MCIVDHLWEESEEKEVRGNGFNLEIKRMPDRFNVRIQQTDRCYKRYIFGFCAALNFSEHRNKRNANTMLSKVYIFGLYVVLNLSIGREFVLTVYRGSPIKSTRQHRVV